MKYRYLKHHPWSEAEKALLKELGLQKVRGRISNSELIQQFPGRFPREVRDTAVRLGEQADNLELGYCFYCCHSVDADGVCTNPEC